MIWDGLFRILVVSLIITQEESIPKAQKIPHIMGSVMAGSVIAHIINHWV